MLGKTVPLVVLGALMLMAGFVNAQASKYTVSLQASDLSTFSPSDESLGKYYTLTFQIPNYIGTNELEKAVLELYVDVKAKNRDGYVDNTPVLEVYALKSTFSGTVDRAQFEVPSPAIRPLPLGDNKRVVVDITPIVQTVIKDSSRNHGLIIGSLSGMRNGDFAVRRGSFLDGSIAKLHLFWVPSRGPK